MNTCCSACKNILRDAEYMFQDRRHNIATGRFNNIDQWVYNVKSVNPCHLCALLLYRSISSKINRLIKDGRTEASYKLVSNRSDDESSLSSPTLGITLSSESELDLIYSTAHVTIAFREDGKSRDFKGEIHAMTWSSNTVYQVREWLKSCAESHPQCTGSRSKLDNPDKRSLPSRLLDTGPFLLHEEEMSTADVDSLSLEVNPYLRLCDTKSFPTDTKYLTLSHRWSNPPAVTLNNATAEQFKSSIPLSEMLKPEAATLKQAVQVTRCLGFRYLWIDALCINQEEEQDKQHEISLMGEIYAGSELNLAATAAFSGASGLFHMRNPMVVEPFRKRVRIYGDNGWFCGDLIVYTTECETEVDIAPLNRRGWVFQERLLAHRVLHFARNQVYWTCSSLLAAEVMPYGNLNLKSFFGEEIRRWHLDIPLDETSISVHQSTWTALIKNYSIASLTFPQDKLVAISAIARNMCRVRNLSPSDYLAGLWRPDLPAHLLWSVQLPWKTKLESLPYIAPSWSWASLATPGVFLAPFPREAIVADLVDASISLKTMNPFGELTSGYIRLRGPMWKLNSRISPLTGAVEIGRHGTYYPRNIITTYWDYVRLPEECSSPGDRKRHCEFKITPPHLYLFLISIYKIEQEERSAMYGLVLQPIDRVKGRYRRLGCFVIDTAKLDNVGGALDLFSTITLEDDEFISFEEPNLYVIDII